MTDVDNNLHNINNIIKKHGFNNIYIDETITKRKIEDAINNRNNTKLFIYNPVHQKYFLCSVIRAIYDNALNIVGCYFKYDSYLFENYQESFIRYPSARFQLKDLFQIWYSKKSSATPTMVPVVATSLAGAVVAPPPAVVADPPADLAVDALPDHAERIWFYYYYLFFNLN